MAEIATVTVLLISSSGLRFANVPGTLPRTFRVYEPAIRYADTAPTKPRLRLYHYADQYSYVEQEREP